MLAHRPRAVADDVTEPPLALLDRFDARIAAVGGAEEERRANERRRRANTLAQIEPAVRKVPTGVLRKGRHRNPEPRSRKPRVYGSAGGQQKAWVNGRAA